MFSFAISIDDISRLIIEKSFPYSDKIHHCSSISNNVTTVSLALSYFSLLSIELFGFGNRPRRLWFISKKNFLDKTNLCKLSTAEALQNSHRKVSTSNDQG